MDIQHIIELVITNVFSAGVIAGVIKTKFVAIDKRLDRSEEETDRAHERIDNILQSAR